MLRNIREVMLFVVVQVILLVLLSLDNNGVACKEVDPKVVFEWDAVNFTWPSAEAYQSAVDSGKYDATKIRIHGIAVYDDNFYVSLPRSGPEMPVALAKVSKDAPKANPLLTPYPSWEMNAGTDCATIQNVQAIEIDKNGVLWVADGYRTYNPNNCLSKILLFDLKRDGKLLHVFEIPNSVSPIHEGDMTQIAIEESHGGYAYIADACLSDPGIIVLSRKSSTAWKLRHSTMHPDLNALDLNVHGVKVHTLFGVSAVALGPSVDNVMKGRTLYYSAFNSFNIYSINTDLVKNETLVQSHSWIEEVKHVGRRPSQSSQMVIDMTGNMYYGLIPLNAIGKWNVNELPFGLNSVISYQSSTIDSPDTLAFDVERNLYVALTDTEIFFAKPGYKPVPVRILKFNFKA